MDPGADFVRIPVEVLACTFRAAQRQTERELTALTRKLMDLGAGKGAVSADSATATLASIRERLDALSSMLAEADAVEQECLDAFEERATEHGETLRASAVARAAEAAPATPLPADRRRADTFVLDLMLREGHVRSASALAEESGLQRIVELRFLQSASAAARALVDRHDLQPALDFCAEHRSRLRRAQSPLELALRVQGFVEAVRAGNRLSALQYARAHLAAFADTHREAVARVMGTLAFADPASCEVEEYRALFSEQRWVSLASLFDEECRRLIGMAPAPPLEVTLVSGLAALKTRLVTRPRPNRYPGRVELLAAAATRARGEPHRGARHRRRRRRRGRMDVSDGAAALPPSSHSGADLARAAARRDGDAGGGDGSGVADRARRRRRHGPEQARVRAAGGGDGGAAAATTAAAAAAEGGGDAGALRLLAEVLGGEGGALEAASASGGGGRGGASEVAMDEEDCEGGETEGAGGVGAGEQEESDEEAGEDDSTPGSDDGGSPGRRPSRHRGSSDGFSESESDGAGDPLLGSSWRALLGPDEEEEEEEEEGDEREGEEEGDEHHGAADGAPARARAEAEHAPPPWVRTQLLRLATLLSTGSFDASGDEDAGAHAPDTRRGGRGVGAHESGVLAMHGAEAGLGAATRVRASVGAAAAAAAGGDGSASEASAAGSGGGADLAADGAARRGTGVGSWVTSGLRRSNIGRMLRLGLMMGRGGDGARGRSASESDASHDGSGAGGAAASASLQRAHAPSNGAAARSLLDGCPPLVQPPPNPVSDPALWFLSLPLPSSRPDQSRLVCRLSGRLMDERNPPMALPNGQVYSQQALSAHAAANDGVVMCPATGERFPLTKARRVFVL